MANSSEGKRLTEAYRQSQSQLQAQILARGRLLQPLLGMNDVDVAAQIYVPGMVEVIRDGVRQQEAITGAYIEAHSKAETGRALTPVVPAFDETAAILDMQIRGPIAAKSTVGRGFDEQAAQAKANRLGAVGAARDVLQFGRTMIIRSAASTESDLGRGRGGRWRRVTDGKPCAFCAMLAGRGPVYTSQTVDFHTHDLCGCVGEIVYNDWEPTEAERAWRQAYVDAGNEATVVDGRRVAPKKGNGEDTILWRMRRDNPDLFHDGWKPMSASRRSSKTARETPGFSRGEVRAARHSAGPRRTA